MIIGVRTTAQCYWIFQYNTSLKYESDIFLVMSGVPQHPCTICGNGGHSASRCKELGIPPEGFYKPAPGQHQHDDDCEDTVSPRHKRRDDCEAEVFKRTLYLRECYTVWLNQLLKEKCIKRLF